METTFAEYFPCEQHAARLPELDERHHQRGRTRVAVVGGGPTGLAVALGLARHGVAATVLEADATVCTGSRAGAFTRRTIEIFERLGIADEVLRTGLAWRSGTTYWREQAVFQLEMPHDDDQQYLPAVSQLQNRIEQVMVEQAQRGGQVDLRWRSQVAAVEPGEQGVRLAVTTPAGDYTLDADWVVACDGGRSRVRGALGLALEGTRHAGRYVIIDVRMATDDLPAGRRCWFDPPSRPGGTVLMYKKPDGMVRFDYQLAEDEDETLEMQPERVFERVNAHLAMLGCSRPWTPVWMTLYRASAMTLAGYRHGRVLFAGDAAHLVPIFGVRGMNSAIDDAHNLAWKLAWVVRGLAGERLLDSYSEERVYAARENLRYASQSAEFMAPPSAPQRLLRDAVLSLARAHPWVAQLANPRQHSAIPLVHSPLNAFAERSQEFAAGPAPGEVLPECRIRIAGRPAWLTRSLGTGFTALWFGEPEQAPPVRCGALLTRLDLPRSADPTQRLYPKFGAGEGSLYLVRPDGHVLARWREARGEEVMQALQRVLALPAAASVASSAAH